MTRSMLACGLAVACTVPALAQEPAPSLVGRRAPEIVAKPDHWLGVSPSATLEQLRGKVVWLQFTF